MAKNYKTISLSLLMLCGFIPLTLLANGIPLTTGGPGDPDSMAIRMGHCNPVTEIIEYDCETRTITLGAYILWTWTGIREPTSGLWSNGIFAHKITVTPPGSWSWDPTFTGCEASHWQNTFTEPSSFFDGTLGINGPPIFCWGQTYELTLNNPSGYNFPNVYMWPPSEDGSVMPYTLVEPGEYVVTVLDQLGCPHTAEINITPEPPLPATIAGPPLLCPGADTSVLQVVQNYPYYSWNTGDTINPIVITEPGLYQVTVTDHNGCTGEQLFGVQNAEVGNLTISMTAPAICPGQLDTLRVVGGFSQYQWSNGTIGITNIVNQPGTYMVTVTNLNGCTGTGSVTVAPLPTPSLAVVSTPLCPGETAILTALGDSIAGFLWSTGATGSSISVTGTGTYSVVGSGSGICPVQAQISVVPAPAPVVNISPPATLSCSAPQITLDAGGSSAGADFTITWTSAGGNIVSGSNTLSPLVDAPGDYQLEITNNLTGCSNALTVTVESAVQAPPAPASTPGLLTCNYTEHILGPAVPPSDSTLSVWWTPPPGGNIVLGQNTWNPVVNAPGLYTLLVSDPVTGCTASSQILMEQNIDPPIAAINPPPMITCNQQMITLDGTGSSTGAGFAYAWTAAAGGALAGNTDAPTATATAVGTYTLVVTNLLNGCSASALTLVNADQDIPVAIIQPPQTLTCAVEEIVLSAQNNSPGASFTYQWNGPGLQNGQGTLAPLVDAPGTYTLLVVNNENNCSATYAVQVLQDVTAPVAEAGANDTLNCTATALTLNGASSSQGPEFAYLWTTANGQILSGTNSLSLQIGSPGEYTLQISNLINGCAATDVVQVFEDAMAPVAIVAPPDMLTCTATAIALDASASTSSSFHTFNWFGPGILAGQSTPIVTVNQPGDYMLEITNTMNGCKDSAWLMVAQDVQLPAADAGQDQELNCYTPVQTIGSGNNPNAPYFTLNWTTTDGQFASATNEIFATVNTAGTYLLTIVNQQNGCTATDAVTISENFTAPAVDAGPSYELNCTLNSVILQGQASAGATLNYAWTTPDGNILSGGQTLTPMVDAAGLYTLTVLNAANGCSATDDVIITLSADVPAVAIQPPGVLNCLQAELNLDASGSAFGPDIFYQWQVSNGGNILSGNNSLQPTVNAPGTYTLVVSNLATNCSASESVMIISDTQSPELNLSVGGIITCANTTQNIEAVVSASSSNALQYLWNTGQTDPNISVDQAGLYRVTVSDLSNGCTTAGEITVLSNTQSPEAAIAPAPALTCLMQEITLDGTASSSGNNFLYQWFGPGGQLLNGATSNTLVANAPGTYSLLVTDAFNGCTQTALLIVSSDTLRPIAQAGAGLVLNCYAPTGALDGTGSSQGTNFTYLWSTQNGQILAGADQLQPSIGQAGTYELLVSNAANGCTSTSTVSVSENFQTPELNIAPPPVLNCLIQMAELTGSGSNFGNAPVYQWNTNDGNLVSGQNSSSALADRPGTYTLTIRNTESGCTDLAQVQLMENITPPALSVQPADLLTCSIEQVMLAAFANPQHPVIWQTTDGNILAGATTLQPVVNAPGAYHVMVSSPENGCTAARTVIVEREEDVPTGVQYLVQPPLCNGTPGAVVFNSVSGGVGPFAYSLDNGETYMGLSEISDLSPGNYELMVRDANGCTVQETFSVPEPIEPGVSLPPDFTINIGDYMQLQAILPPSFSVAQIAAVTWEPMEGLTFSGNSVAELLQPQASPYITTQYTVTIVSKEGCEAQARTLVRVDRDIDIYAPNVIWPEDPLGENQAFTLFTRKGTVRNIQELQIYDRWGEQMWVNRNFLPDDPAVGWDGFFNGQAVNPGVFVWWAKIELIDGRVVLMKGDLTVVR
jgi:hypothetical protein